MALGGFEFLIACGVLFGLIGLGFWAVYESSDRVKRATHGVAGEGAIEEFEGDAGGPAGNEGGQARRRRGGGGAQARGGGRRGRPGREDLERFRRGEEGGNGDDFMQLEDAQHRAVRNAKEAREIARRERDEAMAGEYKKKDEAWEREREERLRREAEMRYYADGSHDPPVPLDCLGPSGVLACTSTRRVDVPQEVSDRVHQFLRTVLQQPQPGSSDLFHIESVATYTRAKSMQVLAALRAYPAPSYIDSFGYFHLLDGEQARRLQEAVAIATSEAGRARDIVEQLDRELRPSLDALELLKL